MGLFPTSGYMAMAIQAAMEINGSRPVRLIEIRDFAIPSALTIEENNQMRVSSTAGLHATHVQAFPNASKEILYENKEGKHLTAQREWLDHTEELILEYKHRYPEQADIKLIHAVAENLVGVMASDTQLLEVMLVDNMLSNLYIISASEHVEIGAGTGATTHSVLHAIRGDYGRSTYTDISARFIEAAKKLFKAHSKRLDYKAINIENDPVGQGIPSGGQDIVLTAYVLHATRNLKETMANVRKSLKSCRYLIMVEVMGHYLQMMFLMGRLPG
ncbi:hypothetical protein CEP54_016190 [Fusarium duplospermum]|uniref:Methyltransferase type 12 domain-containing protein n=1 Tax=Fusarium duplospermum TaxID=1325734 RepID=A0A428NHA5_9HYPO|nr:hypothetical protein CEP54_016190 [Fusarium duplospermum]